MVVIPLIPAPVTRIRIIRGIERVMAQSTLEANAQILVSIQRKINELQGALLNVSRFDRPTFANLLADLLIYLEAFRCIIGKERVDASMDSLFKKTYRNGRSLIQSNVDDPRPSTP